MQIKLSKQSSSKYQLPKIATKRQQNIQCTSIFHKQRRKYLLKRVESETVTLRQKNLNVISNIGNISSILKTVRNEFDTQSKIISNKQTLKVSNMTKIVRRQLKTQRKQKKVISPNPIQQTINQPSNRQTETVQQVYSHFNEALQRKLFCKEICIQNKPPHRYKTQMIAYQSSLILFGGVGCDKHLTWAKISFNPQKLQLPPKQTEQKDILANNTPIYGHTMKAYKGFAYIFGGMNGDILNQIFLLNLKTMKYKPGVHAPFRRKQHAATMIGKFMLVHGGIQGNQTKNNLFYYDTEAGQWTTLPSPGLPYLSHHSMITVPSKSKRKIAHISENNDTVYIFGGKNQKGQASNKLYKLKIIHDYQIQFEQVIPSQFSQPVPDKRYNCCFEYIDNGNILLYGGKQDTQSYDFHVKNGTFRDTYLFNIYKRTWKKQETNVDFRQSMASVSVGGKVYIFGGSGDTYYADANLLVMKVSQNGTFHTLKRMEDSGTKQNISCISSTKKIDYT